jgi:uncharacterized protein
MPPNKTRHQAFWTNPATLILGVAVLFFGSQVLGASVLPFVKMLLPTENQQLAVFVGINLLGLLGMLTIAFMISGHNWRSLGLSKPKFKAVLEVLPAFAVYFVISTALTLLAIKLFPSFRVDQAQDIGFQDLKSNLDLVAGFLSLVILTPIFEEIIFRGVLFRGLRTRYRFWPCAIVVSVIFAAAHGQWNVALDTFALSLIMCVLVERSKSIIPSILLHAAKNSVAFVFLFLLN